MALLMGVRWFQGTAFGSPVVPDENSTLVVRYGSPVTDSKVSSFDKRSDQEMSPGRRRGMVTAAWRPCSDLPDGTTMTVDAPASTTVS